MSAFLGENGNGGTPFPPLLRDGEHVRQVIVISTMIDNEKYIQGVKLIFSNGESVGKCGSGRGDRCGDEVFDVDEGDCITKAIVYLDKGTDGFEFETRLGVKSAFYGTKERIGRFNAAPMVQEGKEGEELCGMKGRSGCLMDRIEFLFGKPKIKYAPLRCKLWDPYTIYAQKTPDPQENAVLLEWELPTLAIVVVTPKERQAVLARFEDNTLKEVLINNTAHVSGKIGRFYAVVIQSRMGANVTENILDLALTKNKCPELENVKAIVFVGICFGTDPVQLTDSDDTNRQRIGDIIFAQRCLNMSEVKMEDGKVYGRATVDSPRSRILNKVNDTVIEGWQRQIPTPPSNHGRKPMVHVGTVASSAVLVNDKDYIDSIRKGNKGSSIIGGDMEVYQVAKAAIEHSKDWFSIKAICDFGGIIRKDDNGQKFAAAMAADFLHYLMAKNLFFDDILGAPPETSTQPQITRQGIVQDNNANNRFHLRSAAEQGSGDAQFELADLFEKEHNYSEAFYFYLKAADNNYVVAQSKVGKMYLVGKGVSQNQSEAIRFLRLAAEQGNGDAQFALADMFEKEHNYSEAFYFYCKAADNKYVVAQYKVGMMYLVGTGVSQDRNKAIRYLQLAAENGFQDAKAQIAKMVDPKIKK